jgi:hypothetical protein
MSPDTDVEQTSPVKPLLRKDIKGRKAQIATQKRVAASDSEDEEALAAKPATKRRAIKKDFYVEIKPTKATTSEVRVLFSLC